MRTESYQFVVFGSGFGGSIISMILRQMRKSVLLVEQGRHPRFAIGESSTPFANLLLEKIADDYDLPFLRQFAEFGSWQRHHPEVAVGLKRGFTFFRHRCGERLDFGDRSAQLLVAASPNDCVADTHWYRADFDHYLVRKATEFGVNYADQTSVNSIAANGAGWEIMLKREGQERAIRTAFIIDASGANSVLAHHFSIPTTEFHTMPKTAGVWAHFQDVHRADVMHPALRNRSLPYPPDDAAVHHVFPGGWCWILRFNNGITSAGAAFSHGAEILGASPKEKWGHLLEKMPSVLEQFGNAKAVTSFFEAPQLSFLRSNMVGSNWAMLPSAAGFVDPLLSTGFALTLLGIDRLAKAIKHSNPSLKGYEVETRLELEAAADLVSALYAKMHSFEEFSLLTLLYFAAMSFTETAWRLNKRELASAFLLTNDRTFSEQCLKLCAAARAGDRITRQDIQAVIAPYDIAGLTEWSRNNWYAVNLPDLASNAHKLQASKADMTALFQKLLPAIPT